MALQLLLLPHFDPKRRLKAHSLNYLKLGLTVVGLLGGLLAYALYAAVHPGTDASRGMMVLTGLFLAAMGNYLTTVPPNYFVGIRTP